MRVVSKSLHPLCFLPNGQLLCYKYGELLTIDSGKVVATWPLLHGFKEKVLGRQNIFYRFFRLGIRTAHCVDDNTVLLCIGHRLYEYDLSTKTLSDGVGFPNLSRPLIYTQLHGVQGFDDCVVFGEYFMNMDLNPVHVYRRLSTDKWESVYTFSQGSINHVHNIVPDPNHHCLWIFTGDYDHSAAIWRVTENFRKVECVLSGDQKYRGCVAFSQPEGVVYVTDSPYAPNSIYLLDNHLSLKKLGDFPGSCIYGCKWNDKYVFASTVESDGIRPSLWELLTSRKRGKGIKDDFVHLYLGNPVDGFKDVYREKKDFWPFLFQLGAIKFPSGVNNGELLYFQPVATKRNDLSLLAIDWREL